MKALTVRQPWASLIAHGHKRIETRPAPPNGPMRPEGVRGLPGASIERGERVAIHAAATRPEVGTPVGDWYWGSAAADPECIVYGPLDRWECHPAPLGAVVATAVVTDALPIIDAEHGWRHDADTPPLAIIVELGWSLVRQTFDWDTGISEVGIADDLPLGDFTPGRWGWLLDDVRPLGAPIPCKGRQGVWTLPDHITRVVTV